MLQLNKAYIELTMKSNGKADLYFHGYFWERYLRSLYDNQEKNLMGQLNAQKKKMKKAEVSDDETVEKTEESEAPPVVSSGGKVEIFSDKFPFMKRLIGLSATISKVIANIKKFPFHEKMYLKYAGEFGQRNLGKKMKYLEEIQRALFVAQIADDQNGLYWIEKLLIQL